MDPKATLDRAKAAIESEDWDEARDALHDYREWRERGGFEPPRGDARHRELARIVSNLSSYQFSTYMRKRKRNPVRGMVPMADIKQRNREASGHFFDPASMRFFRSKLHGNGLESVSGNVYFITSEQFDAQAPRRYTVRVMFPNGKIESASEFQHYATLKEATASRNRKADEDSGTMYGKNPARVTKRAKREGRALAKRYGSKARAREVAGGMIGSATSKAQREHFVRVRRALNPSKSVNRQLRLGWTHVLLSEDSDGHPLVWTGQAGSGWASRNFEDRFAVDQEYAEKRAKSLNANSGVTGLTWRVENLISAEKLFKRRGLNPVKARGGKTVYWIELHEPSGKYYMGRVFQSKKAAVSFFKRFPGDKRFDHKLMTGTIEEWREHAKKSG